MEPAWTLTEPFHRAPYAAISPLRPELTQAGKTILVTGGNAGIGYAIAKAFSQASARKVIILGRRLGPTKDAAAQLARSYSNAEFTGMTCDISSAVEVEELWHSLGEQGIVVDVLVLNAVKISDQKPILEVGTEGIWKDYDMNQRDRAFLGQRYYLVNVSSYAIHKWKVAANTPGYGLTKSAASLAMQLIAQDMAPEKMHVINMNPGGVFTQNTRDAGYNEDSYAWNDADLPGQFSVWLASPEATFLHGRFVWTEWDVNELKNGALRKRIDEDPYYLKVGVRGL